MISKDAVNAKGNFRNMNGKPALEQFVSVKAAAESLCCTEQFIYSMISSGDLRAIKMGTRAIRISATSLSEYVEARWIDPATYCCEDDQGEAQLKERRPTARLPVAASSFMQRK